MHNLYSSRALHRPAAANGQTLACAIWVSGEIQTRILSDHAYYLAKRTKVDQGSHKSFRDHGKPIFQHRARASTVSTAIRIFSLRKPSQDKWLFQLSGRSSAIWFDISLTGGTIVSQFTSSSEHGSTKCNLFGANLRRSGLRNRRCTVLLFFSHLSSGTAEKCRVRYYRITVDPLRNDNNKPAVRVRTR